MSLKRHDHIADSSQPAEALRFLGVSLCGEQDLRPPEALVAEGEPAAGPSPGDTHTRAGVSRLGPEWARTAGFGYSTATGRRACGRRAVFTNGAGGTALAESLLLPH